MLPVAVTGIYLIMPGRLEYNNVDVITLISASVFFTGIAAGFVEEMVFRGMILGLLEQRWNKTVAIIAPSVLFGLIHIIGTKISIISEMLVVVAGTMVGIMFSLIALSKKSVWNSGIVHVLWNVIIIGGMLQISSTSDKESIFNYILESKSFALTGGDFGVQASVIALVAYGIVALVAFHDTKK